MVNDIQTRMEYPEQTPYLTEQQREYLYDAADKVGTAEDEFRETRSKLFSQESSESKSSEESSESDSDD